MNSRITLPLWFLLPCIGTVSVLLWLGADWVASGLLGLLLGGICLLLPVLVSAAFPGGQQRSTSERRDLLRVLSVFVAVSAASVGGLWWLGLDLESSILPGLFVGCWVALFHIPYHIGVAGTRG